MNNRERVKAILHYENYDKMPVVHFGYWDELLIKWYNEGHLTEHEARTYGDGNETDRIIAEKLGFDFCWTCCIGSNSGLLPGFEHKIIEEQEDGFVIYQNWNGLIEKVRSGAGSIPATVGTLLTGRQAWEELYKQRLQPDERRYNTEYLKTHAKDYEAITDRPVGMHIGSLFGFIRDMLGVENLSYLQVDDEDLFYEIIDTVGNLCYENAKAILQTGIKPDFGHYWEDICYKNGPLINPTVFDEKVGPHYRKISDLLLEYGIDIISLDCDGCIDKLIPTWLNNGVNTMFPIEVGTWNASITPWREQYGRSLRGVGGMDKRVFFRDYAAVDKEIERLKRCIDLGGFIPCPDHRLSPETIWENVQYYCDRMHHLFG